MRARPGAFARAHLLRCAFLLRRSRLSSRQQRLDPQAALDGVEARGVRLQEALKMVEPLDELFEESLRWQVFGHVIS
jgi:hypothetical protein